MKIYTIGHSTRSFEELLEILKNFQIELVVDVRRFPSSKKFPHFNKENLEKELKKEKIGYVHFPELGGYRKEGYEAFSKSKEFKDAILKLLEIIDGKTAAIVCAEWNPIKCHRWYISEELNKIGYRVAHLISKGKYQNHVELPKKKLKIRCDRPKLF